MAARTIADPPTACWSSAGRLIVVAFERGGGMFKALVVGFVVFLIATFPATWLLMLFLGNVGVNTSYWGTLPLGILVSALLAGASSRSYVVAR
jgi:sorbitol-specific phosphotransferase system component IIC